MFVSGVTLIAALVLGALSGCVVSGNGEGGGQYSASVGQGTLAVRNASNTSIFWVRFSPTTDQQWGEDRLGFGETISPGETYRWSVPPGDYNVKIEFSDGRKLDSLETYTVVASAESTCVVSDGGGTAAAQGTLTVVNESKRSVFRVRFSLTTESNWGVDQLGSAEVISAGDRRSWSVPPGAYHVKIEFDGGESSTASRSMPSRPVARRSVACRRADRRQVVMPEGRAMRRAPSDRGHFGEARGATPCGPRCPAATCRTRRTCRRRARTSARPSARRPGRPRSRRLGAADAADRRQAGDDQLERLAAERGAVLVLGLNRIVCVSAGPRRRPAGRRRPRAGRPARWRTRRSRSRRAGRGPRR